jgi:lactoylglutathione lyase
MQYEHITLYVSDLENALSFYRDLLGLKLLRRISAGNMEIVFLGEPGQPSIELIETVNEPLSAASGFSLGFRVDSLDNATKIMEAAGYPLLRGPISPDPSVRFSFFRGPESVEIQLLEHMEQ